VARLGRAFPAHVVVLSSAIRRGGGGGTTYTVQSVLEGFGNIAAVPQVQAQAQDALLGYGNITTNAQTVAQTQNALFGYGNVIANTQILAQQMAALFGLGNIQTLPQALAQSQNVLFAYGNIVTVSQTLAQQLATLLAFGELRGTTVSGQVLLGLASLTGEGALRLLGQATAQGTIQLASVGILSSFSSTLAGARTRLDGFGIIAATLPIVIINELTGELLLIVLSPHHRLESIKPEQEILILTKRNILRAD